MFTRFLEKIGYTKEEASWILYDVGNSAQVLTTCTVIFPLLIAYITPGDSSVYVGWANTVYGLLLALMSPILGTVADYKGMKMKMFRFFLYIGIVGGFALALPFIDYRMALIIFVIAMVGYNGSIIFYDAFIVDVCENDERVDKVSAAGYAWGYIGSTLPFLIFVIPFAVVTLLGDVQIGPFTLTYRWGCGLTMAMAVLWWLIYSRPMLKNVRQRQYHEPVEHVVRESFVRLWSTFRNVRRNRNIFIFCLSYFFFIDCVNTVIKMAVSLATDMGVSDVMSLVLVIVINLFCFPCAIYFGKLVKRFGSRPMLFVSILGYIAIIIYGSLIPVNVNFIWIVGILIGMFQGGIQATSRSYFTRLIPDKEDSNEYFGFFSVFSKFSSILGPMAISLIIMITGETNIGILGLIPMMLIGGILLIFVKDPK
ncbi:MFS transporter [Merdibacter massiliensis]|uniref:MFS transporter n=1 Tax=Merdibacter massiliensis TaxID=1871030 RepID=UPI00096AC394|nr:MFS transporter [Merdibacter massiliensis]